MLRNMNGNREIYSNMTVTRMRYRGPVESIKVNKFTADTRKDLIILEAKIGAVQQRLEQFVLESLDGSTDVIKLSKAGKVLYEDIEAEDLDLVNHRITSSIKEAK